MSLQIEMIQDLRAEFGPARDQKNRPTCLAFAVSDTHASARSGWAALSCEYVFYQAQTLACRSPSQGANLQSVLSAVEVHGQPIEEVWPYLTETPSDLSMWQPPAGIFDLYRRHSSSHPAEFAQVCRALDVHKPAILLMLLSDSFFTPSSQGIILQQPGEAPVDALKHAVVAVGHGKIEGEPALLIRNSWGEEWGIDGYAWLPQSYLAPRLFAAAILEDEAHVSSN